MRRAVQLDFTSRVASTAEQVFAHATTMTGVNDELAPWVRMTHPPDRASLADGDVTPGAVLFHSWLLVGGVLPFDRHALALTHVLTGPEIYGFDEESTSWVQRRWRHERRIEPTTDAGGCVVSDRLTIVPRLPGSRALTRLVVGALFRRRHRRLVARFGAG